MHRRGSCGGLEAVSNEGKAASKKRSADAERAHTSRHDAAAGNFSSGAASAPTSAGRASACSAEAPSSTRRTRAVASATTPSSLCCDGAALSSARASSPKHGNSGGGTTVPLAGVGSATRAQTPATRGDVTKTCGCDAAKLAARAKQKGTGGTRAVRGAAAACTTTRSHSARSGDKFPASLAAGAGAAVDADWPTGASQSTTARRRTPKRFHASPRAEAPHVATKCERVPSVAPHGPSADTQSAAPLF
jgi:hypothetical protein